MTNIELYEALRPHVGDEGARLIAELIPRADLATVDVLDAKLQGVRNEMHLGFAGMQREFADLKAETRGWLLKFFVPLWIGVYGTLGALIVSIARG